MTTTSRACVWQPDKHVSNCCTDIVRRVRFTAAGEPYVIHHGYRLVFLETQHGWTITPLTYGTSAQVTR